MKNTAMKLISFVMTVLMLLSVSPIAFAESTVTSGTCGDNLTWSLDSEGTLTISGTGAMADYASVADVPWYDNIMSVTNLVVEDGVTTIGKNAFMFFSGITEITLPDSITVIGDSAFHFCVGLLQVTLSDGVTSIGRNAFYLCTSLIEITLPVSLKTIGEAAFFNCNKLDEVNYFGSISDWSMIELEGGNSDLKLADFYYDYCPVSENKQHNYVPHVTPFTCTEYGYTTYICECSESYVDDYTYPDHTFTSEVTKKPTYLEEGEEVFTCFCGYSYTAIIPKVAILDSGTHGDNITWILDAERTLHINGTGYMECRGTWRGYPWYNSKASFKKVVVSEGVLSLSQESFGAPDHHIDEVILPDSLRELGWGCFANQHIKSIDIPDNVSVIDNRAFYNCKSLEYVDFPSDLTIIDGEAFYGCTALKEAKIPDGVTTIGEGAFAECTSLTCLELPYELRTIGRAAFFNCYNVEKIDLPPKVTIIDALAFEVCNTDNIDIPEGISYIEDYTFSNNYSLTSIDIPDSVKSIINFSFADCINLKTIYLPDSIETVWYPFYRCISLTDIYYSGSEEDWNNIAENMVIPLEVTIHYNHECEFEFVSTKAADCTEDGFDLYACKICPNKQRINITVASGHIKGDFVSARTPGCDEKGYSKYTCTICGEIYKDDFTDATGHIKTDYDYKKQPTCTTAGEGVYHCETCCHYVLENIEAFGHDRSNYTEIMAPTCTESGIGTFDCLRCGITEEVIIEATGHDYISEITTPATHLKYGVETFTCVCGDTYNEPVEKIAEHSYNFVVAEPTCTEKGYTTYTCECGDSYVVDYVDSLGHNYSSEVTKAATHLEEGVQTYTCANCADKYTEVIEKLKEHTYTSKIVSEPTCTKEGTLLYICICGHEYTEAIPVIEHTDENGDYTCESCNPEFEFCSQLCHNDNVFAKFIWKIIISICKIFGIAETCVCGRNHY